MIPVRLEVENFLSFGSRQLIDFSNEVLWVISGPNGVGKSSLFNAITYALFGKARDLTAPKLVRQGCTKFHVRYEFELKRRKLRITRNWSKNKSTQTIEEYQNDHKWVQIPGINYVDDVKNWVQEQLGLTYESYCASVMLEQGQSDRIINANGKERLAILKKILGIDRFEQIWKSIDEDRKSAERQLREIRIQYQSLTPITVGDLKASEGIVAAAEQKYLQADAAYSASAGLPSEAKAWQRDTAEQKQLLAEQSAAAERLARKAVIEARLARLSLLEHIVPLLTQEAKLTHALACTTRELSKADQTIAACEQQREQLEATTTRHREQIQQLRRQSEQLRERQTFEEQEAATLERERNRRARASELERELAKFPVDLAEQRARIQKDLAEATAEHQRLTETGGQTKTLFQHNEQRRQKFSQLGATCSECSQPIDAEHAAREQAKLESEATRLNAELVQLRQQYSQVNERKSALEASLKMHDQLLNQRDTFQQRLADLQKDYERPALPSETVSASLSELKANVAARNTELDQLRIQIEQLQSQEPQLERELKRLRTLHAEATREQASLQARQRHEEQELAKVRMELSQCTTEERDVAALETELASLDAAAVRAEAEQLSTDEREADRREQRLAALAQSLSQISPLAQRPVPEVEAYVKQQATLRLQADQERNSAEAKHREFLSRHQEYERQGAEYRDKEHQAMLLRRLTDELGPEGLQRALVRKASREILHHAQKLLSELSGEELMLETSGDSDETLELKVRKRGLPEALDAASLSGGERFRTSVSIAIAISRFAAGRLRPLECVMIDEGFGSLDELGKANITEALKQLQAYVGRILVVSHEPSFTEAFTARIVLEPSETGTVVA